MLNILSARRQRTNRNLQSLNEIHIDARAIRDNFQLLQSLQPEHYILPVLKSNAYGHGTQQIATILRSCDTPLICVDSYPEAQIVRKFSKKEVLIMWETVSSNYMHYNHRWLHVAVRSHSVVDTLIQTWKAWKVHLFLNTGMHREGIQLQDLWVLLSKIKDSKLQVVGVMSHFANADEVDASFDDTQIDVFSAWVQMIRNAWYTPKYMHHNNTAWLARHLDTIFTASRAWLGLLWYSPFTVGDSIWNWYEDLQPALSVWSTVTAIQQLEEWDSVSYGQKWTSEKNTRIAIIPFGYNEWLRRSLRGKRQVRRNYTYFPVVGTICMNLCFIDIGDSDVKLWDRIEVISASKDLSNSVSRFAELDETIIYEVLVNLDGFGKRVIV